MQLSTVLLALTTTFTFAAADSYFCRPALDKSGFIQKAYCCTKFIDVPGNDVGKISEGCEFFFFLPFCFFLRLHCYNMAFCPSVLLRTR